MVRGVEQKNLITLRNDRRGMVNCRDEDRSILLPMGPL